MIARIGLVVVAVVVLAWLGVAERNWRLQQNALAESGRPPVSKAFQDFRNARFLNPDTAPDVLLGLLDVVHGRRERGLAALQSVVRREPENLFAWGQIFKVAQGHDRPAARRALTELARLDPIDYGRLARSGG